MSTTREMVRGITWGLTVGLMMTAARPAAAATRTWDGGGVNNRWMTPANWTGNVAPVAGDDLVFPAGVAVTVMINDFPAGTKFDSIVFADGYSVEGNRILIGSAIQQITPDQSTITSDLTIESGLLASGVTFTIAANATLSIQASIGSTGGPFQPGMRKNGPGLLRLLGVNNDYGGVTAIEEGELRIGHQSALGSPQWNTVVSNGAVLALDMADFDDVPEPLMLAGQGTSPATGGALVFLQSATVTGGVTLFGAATPVITVVSEVGEISGAIGGSAGFIKNGSSPLRLSGVNTYTGMTTIANGAIVVAHADALGSPSSGVTVLQGGTVRVDTSSSIQEPLFAQTNAAATPALQCLTPLVCTWVGPIDVWGFNTFEASSGHTLLVAGAISGEGSVDYSGGGGRVELLAGNTYVGASVLGHVRLGAGASLPANTHVLFTGAPRTLDLNNQSQTIRAITGGVQDKILLGGGTLTIDTADAFPSFAGTISGNGGNGGLAKKGTGTFSLSNMQLYTGLTSLYAGHLILAANTVLPGPVFMHGGTLRGGGSLHSLTATGGRIEPGQSPGMLTTKTLNLVAPSTLALELNGPAAGTQHDQIVATTSVALSNASLELSSTSFDAFSSPLVIVKNDGPNPVTGTFAGLPEGALVFTSAGRGLKITYAGGDGNDIVVSPVTPAYYLSEGATGAFFDLDILIANPSDTDVTANLTFLLPDGSKIESATSVPAWSRRTIKVDDLDGLGSTAVSTIVTSPTGRPLIVERTMRWDASGYGAHTEKAVSGMSKDWYFAEGAQGFFSTYVLLANPQPAPNVATVRYLRENAPAIVRTYPVEANSRFTVDAGADPELVGSSFGMHVTFEQPGVAERSMYFGVDPLWKAGHESAGVIAPSPTWFLAEGATGPFFETFVLLANPGDQPAEATVTFLPDTGVPVVKTVPVPAQGRVTLNIEAEDPSLANAAVATQVSATQPILVERAQYWPDPAPQWYEAHNSFGVTATGKKWGLAEGRFGFGALGYQTYILLANPGMAEANVIIRFLREGAGPIERTFVVKPQSRYNVDTGAVPELTDLNFGAVITADQPIAVERAMYSNANGQLWAAGTNATGTPLP